MEKKFLRNRLILVESCVTIGVIDFMLLGFIVYFQVVNPEPNDYILNISLIACIFVITFPIFIFIAIMFNDIIISKEGIKEKKRKRIINAINWCDIEEIRYGYDDYDHSKSIIIEAKNKKNIVFRYSKTRVDSIRQFCTNSSISKSLEDISTEFTGNLVLYKKG